tara:strand:- start:525 stop:635 length:111 start_codon:yes stop_codon:yes gene_type:complete
MFPSIDIESGKAIWKALSFVFPECKELPRDVKKANA